MEALFLLIPLSLLGVAVAVWFFLKMNASGQFDDADGDAWRVLMDDDRADVEPEQENSIARPIARPVFDRDQVK